MALARLVKSVDDAVPIEGNLSVVSAIMDLGVDKLSVEGTRGEAMALWIGVGALKPPKAEIQSRMAWACEVAFDAPAFVKGDGMMCVCARSRSAREEKVRGRQWRRRQQLTESAS